MCDRIDVPIVAIRVAGRDGRKAFFDERGQILPEQSLKKLGIIGWHRSLLIPWGGHLPILVWEEPRENPEVLLGGRGLLRAYALGALVLSLQAEQERHGFVVTTEALLDKSL